MTKIGPLSKKIYERTIIARFVKNMRIIEINCPKDCDSIFFYPYIFFEFLYYFQRTIRRSNFRWVLLCLVGQKRIHPKKRFGFLCLENQTAFFHPIYR